MCDDDGGLLEFLYFDFALFMLRTHHMYELLRSVTKFKTAGAKGD